jgi:Response regulators consisting of a CheY-like receiver domain and a winged-helix DNA-binding domain
MTRGVAQVSSTEDQDHGNQVLTVLHVEDDETISGIVKEILESEGWSVDTCSDGVVALERICGNRRYDLLLVDHHLPGLNGLELVHRTRHMGHRSNIPIIVLSATPMNADAREAGADIFLQKPIHITPLLQAIDRVCRKR